MAGKRPYRTASMRRNPELQAMLESYTECLDALPASSSGLAGEMANQMISAVHDMAFDITPISPQVHIGQARDVVMALEKTLDTLEGMNNPHVHLAMLKAVVEEKLEEIKPSLEAAEREATPLLKLFNPGKSNELRGL